MKWNVVCRIYGGGSNVDDIGKEEKKQYDFYFEIQDFKASRFKNLLAGEH